MSDQRDGDLAKEIYGPKRPGVFRIPWIGRRFQHVLDYRTRADGSPIAARSPKMYRRIIRSALMARSREVFKRRRGESGGAIGERIERRLAEWRKDLGKALKGVNSHAKKRAIAEALRYGREKKAFVTREAEKMRAERRAVLRGQMAAARERESASPTSSDDSR